MLPWSVTRLVSSMGATTRLGTGLDCAKSGREADKRAAGNSSRSLLGFMAESFSRVVGALRCWPAVRASGGREEWCGSHPGSSDGEAAHTGLTCSKRASGDKIGNLRRVYPDIAVARYDLSVIRSTASRS